LTSSQCDSERRGLLRDAFDQQRAPFKGQSLSRCDRPFKQKLEKREKNLMGSRFSRSAAYNVEASATVNVADYCVTRSTNNEHLSKGNHCHAAIVAFLPFRPRMTSSQCDSERRGLLRLSRSANNVHLSRA
jgi:hypothetical protein